MKKLSIFSNEQYIGMTGAQYIVSFFKKKRIQSVFELSGGMIMDLIDTLHLDGGIDIVNVHHEQAAAFAADAVGRLSVDIPGVAIATSGPGATNLLTGIGSCFFDSSPALFITGQVKSNEQKGSKSIRQLGFQETDIVSMAKPITKLAYRVSGVDEIPYVLEQAYRLTLSGRPGPVLIDIPMELFRTSIKGDFKLDSKKLIDVEATPVASIELISKIVQDMLLASKPLLLIGGGLRASGASDLMIDFSSQMNIPVVWSLMAKGLMPTESPYAVGMVGTYGNRWTNLAVAEADFLLVLGSRLDIRQTGANTTAFSRGKTIYHVDIEIGEINNRVLNCIPVVADLKNFVQQIQSSASSFTPNKNAEWIKRIADLKRQWPDTAELLGVKGINPNIFMSKLSSMGDVSVYTADVGQHQMWAAQSIKTKPMQRFITSGGMGAMGFALPAAIGAAFEAKKLKTIVAIAGDAGFQLSLQELQTVVRNKLPVKIIVINNGCHGMTRQFQETYFNERYQGTIWGYDAPNFESVANAYGMAADTIVNLDEIDAALDKFFADPLEPYLLQVMVDTFTNVYPKLAFGREISDMEPFADPIEMEGT